MVTYVESAHQTLSLDQQLSEMAAQGKGDRDSARLELSTSAGAEDARQQTMRQRPTTLCDNNATTILVSQQQANHHGDNESSTNSTCGSGPGSKPKRLEATQKLNLILPQTQRGCLSTPIIVTSDQPASGQLLAQGGAFAHSTTSQLLFNSLAHSINGQGEVSMFTGLPSFTPASADRIVAASGINPFFWGATPTTVSSLGQASDQQQTVGSLVQSQAGEHTADNANGNFHFQQQQQQKQQQQQQHQYQHHEQQQRAKLTLANLQANALSPLILPPLSLLGLSPEQEAWLRYGYVSPNQHPLANRSFTQSGINPLSEQQQQHQQHQQQQQQHLQLHHHQQQQQSSHLYDDQRRESMAATTQHYRQQADISSHQAAAQDLTSSSLSHSAQQPSQVQQPPSEPPAQQRPPANCAHQQVYDGGNTNLATQQQYARNLHENNIQQPSRPLPQRTATPSRLVNNVAVQQPQGKTMAQASAQNQISTVAPVDYQRLPNPMFAHKTSHQSLPATMECVHIEQGPMRYAPTSWQASGGAGRPVSAQAPGLTVAPVHSTSRPQQQFEPLHEGLSAETARQSLGGSELEGGQCVPYAAQQAQAFPHQQHQLAHYRAAGRGTSRTPPRSASQNSQLHARRQPSVLAYETCAQPDAALATDRTLSAMGNKRILSTSSDFSFADRLPALATSARERTQGPPHANSLEGQTSDCSQHSSAQLAVAAGDELVTSDSSASSSGASTSSVWAPPTKKQKSSSQIPAKALASARDKSALVDENSSEGLAPETEQSTPRAHSKTSATTTGDSNQQDCGEPVKKKSRGGRKKKIVTHEEMIARKNRSKERNRVAARRCRQKRKQFLDELRDKIDKLNELNQRLQKENKTLKKELDLFKQHHNSCST